MSWIPTSVTDLCEEIVDCVNRTAPVVEQTTPYLMIRTSNIKGGRINLDDVKHVTKDIFDKWTRRSVPQIGDVLLTREAPVGEVGMIRTNDNVFLGQRIVMYRADRSVCDPRFLYYSFFTSFVQAQVHAFSSGSTVAHVKVPDAKKLLVKLPDLNTQERIADILSAYDDLIENNLRRIQLLEEAARCRYKLMTEESSSWEKINLYDLADIQMGFAFKASDFNEEGRGTPIIRIRDIPNQLTKSFTTQQADQAYRVVQGDLLIGMDGEFHMNEWAGQEGYLVQRVCRLRTCNPLYQSFLRHALVEPILYYQNTISGATVAHLGAKHLKEIYLLVPPENEYKVALDSFNQIRNLTINLYNQNARLRQARDILLPRLMSGEIDVSTVAVPKSEAAALELA